jgi:hypothetical protein
MLRRIRAGCKQRRAFARSLAVVGVAFLAVVSVPAFVDAFPGKLFPYRYQRFLPRLLAALIELILPGKTLSLIFGRCAGLHTDRRANRGAYRDRQQLYHHVHGHSISAALTRQPESRA